MEPVSLIAIVPVAECSCPTVTLSSVRMAGQRGEERDSAYQAVRGMIADAAGVFAATTSGEGNGG